MSKNAVTVIIDLLSKLITDIVDHAVTYEEQPEKGMLRDATAKILIDTEGDRTDVRRIPSVERTLGHVCHLPEQNKECRIDVRRRPSYDQPIGDLREADSVA